MKSGCTPMERSSFTRVLRGLGLHLVGGGDVGHERHVRETARLPAAFSFLNWRAASMNGCDSMSPMVPPISEMTMSAPDLLGDAAQALLDGLGDVRDHLHGAAQEVAAPLARDERSGRWSPA